MSKSLTRATINCWREESFLNSPLLISLWLIGLPENISCHFFKIEILEIFLSSAVEKDSVERRSNFLDRQFCPAFTAAAANSIVLEPVGGTQPHTQI